MGLGKMSVTHPIGIIGRVYASVARDNKETLDHAMSPAKDDGSEEIRL
jgi:hypothetical protein